MLNIKAQINSMRFGRDEIGAFALLFYFFGILNIRLNRIAVRRARLCDKISAKIKEGDGKCVIR